MCRINVWTWRNVPFSFLHIWKKRRVRREKGSVNINSVNAKMEKLKAHICWAWWKLDPFVLCKRWGHKGEEEEEQMENVEFDSSEIEYVSYGGEHHLPLIMNLVDQELSEPYSIFTYRYFVYLWPQLSFLVPQLFTFFFEFSLIESLLGLWVFLLLICFLHLFGFRRSTRVNAWARWYVRWGNTATLSEATLPCWLWSNLIEEEALVVLILCCPFFFLFNFYLGKKWNLLDFKVFVFGFDYFLSISYKSFWTNKIRGKCGSRLYFWSRVVKVLYFHNDGFGLQT